MYKHACTNYNIQVLSETVSHALIEVLGDEARETAKFAEIMDKFFDIMNVRNYAEGIRSRKPFRNPYLSANDSRLEV